MAKRNRYVDDGPIGGICPNCSDLLSSHDATKAFRCVQECLALSDDETATLLNDVFPTQTIHQDAGAFSATYLVAGVITHFSGSPKNLTGAKAIVYLQIQADKEVPGDVSNE